METYLIPLIITGFTGLLIYLGKQTTQRLDEVEKKAGEGLTEDSVRQILSDKIDPLREDIKDLKEQQGKLFDCYIRLRK